MKTFRRCLLQFMAIAVVVVPGFAQALERRATFTTTGEDGWGKCTIEVVVDSVADVEIRGDRAVLRTQYGQPSQWRRFECSGPLPANPVEFKFTGIDGRGSQNLVQDPRNSRGVAVIRIQDPKGGTEGYTFDIEWSNEGRALGLPPGPRGGGNRGFTARDGVGACREAVQQRASQLYGVRDVYFGEVDVDNNPGSNDRVVGSFDVRRGNIREMYRFWCAVNLANGRIRDVEITPVRNPVPSSRSGGLGSAITACQRAADQRIQRDGYRNLRFGELRADNRPGRNDWVVGTATAQSNRDGRAFDFDFGCSVDFNSGVVRSVEVTRR